MRLKEIRMSKGLTQSEIARLLKIDQNSYARIERSGKCNLQTAYDISKILKTTIEEIFFNDEDSKVSGN